MIIISSTDVSSISIRVKVLSSAISFGLTYFKELPSLYMIYMPVERGGFAPDPEFGA